MAKLHILRFPDPRLHTVAKPVAAVDARIRQLVDDMLETMYAADGVGLAATQVDVHERVIVIDTSDTRNDPRVLINPELTAKSDEMSFADEGCLSVPQIYDKVKRHTRVTVAGDGPVGRMAPIRGRGTLVDLRAARDGSSGRQGLRRIPELAQARPHQDQDAEEDPRRRARLMRFAT
jgi:peptide deformylase